MGNKKVICYQFKIVFANVHFSRPQVTGQKHSFVMQNKRYAASLISMYGISPALLSSHQGMQSGLTMQT